MESNVAIEPGPEATTGHCDCCGNESKAFHGFVYLDDQAHGLYLCTYTVGHPEFGVSMAVSLRGWGEGADPTEKECVALEWVQSETGPGCRVSDAATCPWGNESSLGRKLSREEALANGVAQEAFVVTDAVWAEDIRLSAALAGS